MSKILMSEYLNKLCSSRYLHISISILRCFNKQFVEPRKLKLHPCKKIRNINELGLFHPDNKKLYTK